MAGPILTVKVSGLSELDAALRDMTLTKATARNALRRVLVKAGQITADAATALAPNDPATPAPDLHTSIKVGTKLTTRQARLHKKGDDRSFAEAFAGVTGEANSYAHLVEFGSVHNKPKPFMRPAWEQTKDAVLKSIVAGVKPEIDKAAERARRRALKKAGK